MPLELFTGSVVHLANENGRCTVAILTGPYTATVIPDHAPTSAPVRVIALHVAHAAREDRVHFPADCAAVDSLLYPVAGWAPGELTEAWGK